MDTPEVTIVVPTRTRPEQLNACLESISGQEIDRQCFEVVIVEDGSESVASTIASDHKQMILRLVVQPTRLGPAAARNAGAATARGRFLAFIDDDCLASPHWLAALIRELKYQPNALFGGYVENGLPHNRYSTASQEISTYTRQYYERGSGNEWFFPTNNMALSAERFREMGGFDTSIPSQTAEDKEFCDRWRSRTYPMKYVRDALIYHAHDLNCWKFVCQHFAYGRGISVFRRIRRQRGPSPWVPEKFTFYLNLMLYPLRTSHETSAWRRVGLIMVAQLATVAGAVWAVLRDYHRDSPQKDERFRSQP